MEGQHDPPSSTSDFAEFLESCIAFHAPSCVQPRESVEALAERLEQLCAAYRATDATDLRRAGLEGIEMRIRVTVGSLLNHGQTPTVAFDDAVPDMTSGEVDRLLVRLRREDQRRREANYRRRRQRLEREAARAQRRAATAGYGADCARELAAMRDHERESRSAARSDAPIVARPHAREHRPATRRRAGASSSTSGNDPSDGESSSPPALRLRRTRFGLVSPNLLDILVREAVV